MEQLGLSLSIHTYCIQLIKKSVCTLYHVPLAELLKSLFADAVCHNELQTAVLMLHRTELQPKAMQTTLHLPHLDKDKLYIQI